jgi:hypothetical protein
MRNAIAKACFLEPLLSGVAGEYFVAAELSRRGYIASISLRNTRGIDIIVTNQTAARSVTIQCKTNQGGKRVWLLNEKCETFFDKVHFNVFVALGAIDQRPSYHIVPSRRVASYAKRRHRKYLRTPGANGQQRADGSIRKFADERGR